MSTTSLAGRHSLYKAGQERVVRWLVTASSKLTREDSGSSSTQRSTITTSELVQLAEVVAQSEPPVEIPLDILQLLDDVIAGRTTSARSYEAQEDKSNDVMQSNKTHVYFISVLEQVYDILHSTRKKQKASRAAERQAQASKAANQRVASRNDEHAANQSLASLFSHLQVEQPTANVLGSTAVQVQSSARKSSTPTVVLDPKEEQHFALWCMLEDMHDMKLELHAVWQSYEEGEISFDVAGAVTETAFGVMRRSNEELVALYPEFSHYSKALEFLDLALAKGSADARLETRGGDSSVQSDSRLVELLCPRGAHIMTVLLDALTSLVVSPEEGGSRVAVNPALSGPLSTVKECQRAMKRRTATSDLKHLGVLGYRETLRMMFRSMPAFGQTLWHLFPELKTVCEGVKDVKKDKSDEFLAGIYLMHEKRTLPVWLTVACEAYMDVVAAMETRKQEGWLELEKKAEHVWSSVATLESFTQSEYGRTTAVSAKELDELKGEAWNISLQSTAIRASMAESREYAGGGIMSGDTWYPTGISRLLHLTTAQRLNDLTASFHLISVQVADAWALTVGTTYLYHVFQTATLFQARWVELDTFEALQSMKKPLVEGGDMSALFRHFKFATNWQDVSTDNKNRRNVAKHNRDTHRRVESQSSFTVAKLQREQEDEKLGFSRGEAIDIVLKSMFATPQPPPHPSGKAKSKAAEISPTASRNITGLQLVRGFRDLAIKDEPELTFDYMGLWVSCGELLGKLTAKLLPEITRVEPQVVSSDDVMYYLVMLAGRNSKSKILAAAVRVLSEHIDPQAEVDETIDTDAADTADESDGPVDVRKAFAARKKGGRRMLRSRK